MCALNNHLGRCTCGHSRGHHVPWYDACQDCECKAFQMTAHPAYTHQKKIYALIATRRGSVSHILENMAETDTSFPSLCGVSPFPYTWRGGATVEEAEYVRSLRVCVRCIARLPKPAFPYHPPFTIGIEHSD